MQRKVIAELLDDDLGTTSEIAGTLADLRHINAWFGGRRTTISLLRQVARATGVQRLSLLEVATGTGDVPLAAKKTLAREGIALDVTLLDRMASHLLANRAPAVVGDALRLPFRDEAFDVVGCSLFAHHLSPDALLRFAHEALRVCRRALLINDLIRSRIHLVLVHLGLPLFRSRITWHDAPASVRQAYTVDEMRQLLSPLAVQRIEIRRHYLYRMGILVWK
jgi:ubiquinone/menaquinone biosynthesis C-methylase UbiE